MGGKRDEASTGIVLFARLLTWQFKPFSWFLTIPLTSSSCSLQPSRIFGCSCNLKAENWLAEQTQSKDLFLEFKEEKTILNIVHTSSIWDLHSFIRCMPCPSQCMIYRALKMLKDKKNPCQLWIVAVIFFKCFQHFTFCCNLVIGSN